MTMIAIVAQVSLLRHEVQVVHVGDVVPVLIQISQVQDPAQDPAQVQAHQLPFTLLKATPGLSSDLDLEPVSRLGS